MYSQNTRNEFIRLRVQGHSLAAIGQRLAISKPTAIKWNRQIRTSHEGQAGMGELRMPHSAPRTSDVADLTRRLAALNQELLSRSLREVPTAALETPANTASASKPSRERVEPIRT
jgi:hypothetical protein